MAASFNGGGNRSTWRKLPTCRNLYHNVVSSTTRLSQIRTHNVRMIGTDCIGTCKSNYHAITTTTPLLLYESVLSSFMLNLHVFTNIVYIHVYQNVLVQYICICWRIYHQNKIHEFKSTYL